jgi:ribosome-associated protein
MPRMPRRNDPARSTTPADGDDALARALPADAADAAGVADTPADEYDGPSKSQRKRDSHALQTLGEQLVALSPDKLKRMDIPGNLLEAVSLAQRTTSREGRRRQIQYVGKLMRRVDADAIRVQLDEDGRQHRIDTAIQHAAERWRDTLVDSPERLAEFCERYPLASRDKLDAALGAAKVELARGERGRRFRELFRQLRDTMMMKNDDE